MKMNDDHDRQITDNLRYKYSHGRFGEYTHPIHIHFLIRIICGPNAKDWPEEGVGLTKVGNVDVYVKPKNPTGQSKHRVIAICPRCLEDIPAGRLHQHLNTKACRRGQEVIEQYMKVNQK